MDEKQNRPWFRFPLRALFVLVALVALLAGWVVSNANWLRQRRQFLDEAQTRRDIVLFIQRDKPGPWPLRWFGAGGVSAVDFVESPTESELDEAQRLFPEARVRASFAE
jgi:hypothetical protein